MKAYDIQTITSFDINMKREAKGNIEYFKGSIHNFADKDFVLNFSNFLSTLKLYRLILIHNKQNKGINIDTIRTY